MIEQVDEQSLVCHDFLAPCFSIDLHELIEILTRKVKPAPVDVFVTRYPPDRRLASVGPSFHAIHDPLQHPHVLTEAGPQIASCLILAEPVDVENPRCGSQPTLHPDPVANVVAQIGRASGTE